MTTQLMVGARSIARLFLVTGLVVGFASVASANNDVGSLDINDDAARIFYAHPIGDRKIRLDGAWLHHQDRGDVLGVGFHVTGNAATASRPINAGLGVRAEFFSADKSNADGQALAVGAFFDGKLPTYDRIGFGGYLYFAPDVLAFGDAEQFTAVSLYGSYSILRNAELYLGVRNVKADFEGFPDVTFDTGLHIGILLNF